MSSPTSVYNVFAAAIDDDVEFIYFQYGSNADTWVLTDFGEPTNGFPEEQQEVVDWLRNKGRPVLSDKVVTMLKDVQEEPDGPQVNIVSLKQMAEFLVEQKDFADPSIGPDRHGIVYAQWRIIGNGVLVIRFPGDEKILLIAQADAMPHHGHEGASNIDCQAADVKLDICTEGPMPEVLKEHAHLVPRCH